MAIAASGGLANLDSSVSSCRLSVNVELSWDFCVRSLGVSLGPLHLPARAPRFHAQDRRRRDLICSPKVPNTQDWTDDTDQLVLVLRPLCRIEIVSQGKSDGPNSSMIRHSSIQMVNSGASPSTSGSCPKSKYRGLNDYLFCFGGLPYHNNSIIYPKTLF